jgi:uncharacterized protein YjbI with pentapeptide repeats
MANPEHLQILQQGVAAWNQWREHQRDIIPDLNMADLIGAHLSGAYLTGAHLAGADLEVADLIKAHLGGADLRGAHLSGAHLSGAHLSGADLSQAVLYETVFGNINLTAAQGLETCDHRGPSTLGHRTLAQSGPLPLAFLRGCGLPDALIEYLPSLLG